MSKDVFDYKIELLMKEWDYVQNHIGRFDSIVFNIRGWAVSAFTAMLAVSATQKLSELMLLTMLPVGMFWFVDALQKSFQQYFIARGSEIETYLASETFVDDCKSRSDISIAAPGLAASFKNRSVIFRIKHIVDSALLWNVLIIHAALLAVCLLAYLFLRAKP